MVALEEEGAATEPNSTTNLHNDPCTTSLQAAATHLKKRIKDPLKSRNKKGALATSSDPQRAAQTTTA